MNSIFEFLPYLTIAAFGLLCILSVSGSKYSVKTTSLIVIPSTLFILIANSMIFEYLQMNNVSIYNILGLFIPETILVIFIGKRQKLSLFTGIINAFLIVYFISIIENIFINYFTSELVFRIICYTIIYPSGFFYLHFFYNKLQNIVEKSLPKMLWLLLSYGVVVFAEIWFYKSIINTSTNLLKLNTFSAALLSVYIISIVGFYLFMNFYQENQITNFDNKLLNKQINNIIELSSLKDEKENEIRILRHDLKHVLITVNTLINDGEIDKAKEMINAYNIAIENTKKYRFCIDPLINSVLEYYQHQCEKHNITFKTKINNFEELLNIPSNDIVVVISNCLDNAINASLNIKNNRYISFVFLNNKGRLILQIKNKYDGNINLDSNNLPSNEEKDHGFGTKSIELFAKRNNITLDYSITNTSFEITLLFNDIKK